MPLLYFPPSESSRSAMDQTMRGSDSCGRTLRVPASSLSAAMTSFVSGCLMFSRVLLTVRTRRPGRQRVARIMERLKISPVLILACRVAAGPRNWPTTQRMESPQGARSLGQRNQASFPPHDFMARAFAIPTLDTANGYAARPFAITRGLCLSDLAINFHVSRLNLFGHHHPMIA